MRLAIFACDRPWVMIGLLSVESILPFLELRSRGRPTRVYLLHNLLFVAVGGGLTAWASRQHQAETEALEREIASRDDQARAAQLDFEAKIRALEEKAQRDVAAAKTAKDQARILGDLKRQKQALEVGRQRQPRRTAPPMQPTAAPPKPPFRVPQKPEIKDDPLGGDPAIKSGGF